MPMKYLKIRPDNVTVFGLFDIFQKASCYTGCCYLLDQLVKFSSFWVLTNKFLLWTPAKMISSCMMNLDVNWSSLTRRGTANKDTLKCDGFFLPHIFAGI